MKIGQWVGKIYSENDFGRGIATTLSGTIGLIIYLIFNDWVIAAFSTIMIFPIARIIASEIHQKTIKNKELKIEKENAKTLFNKFTDEEKLVIYAFVEIGGCLIPWSIANDLELSRAGVKSLMQREVLHHTFTLDGIREAFALDIEIFDIAQELYSKNQIS